MRYNKKQKGQLAPTFLQELYIYLDLVRTLVDDVEASVLLQHLGNAYALWGLVVLEQRSHDAWQSQCRTVEGVAQMSLLVVATIAALESVGLIGLEIGNRTNLEPAFLSSAPHLEVEGDGTGETHVATTQAKDVPRQLEFLKQALNMVLHLLESSITVLRTLDAHNLHLVELMQAV